MGLLAAWLGGKLARPIWGASRMLERFAGLDFSRPASLAWLEHFRSSEDEIGEMLRASERLRDSLVQVVSFLAGEADRVFRSAEVLSHLANASVDSADRVRTVTERAVALSSGNAALLEAANGGVEEVSSSASVAAASAAEGAVAAEHTAEAGKKTLARVGEVVREIRRIGEKSGETMDNLGSVADSVVSITRFVSTIRGIADQTNLLALNAAIEAARAGEAGRGFAVVAEEVRNLAEESALAAREVETQVEALRKNADRSLRSMKEVDGIVEGTVARSQESVEELEETENRIGRVSEAMQSIAAAARKQASAASEMAGSVDAVTQGISEVVRLVEGIRETSEDTARGAGEVAQEARGLAEGAEALREVVGRFCLADRPGEEKTVPALRRG
jgi:methyl-accepting chemotaxis protein